MTRHTVINPKTGRRVFKTGAIGRAISKQTKSANARKKKPASVPKNVVKGVPIKNVVKGVKCVKGKCVLVKGKGGPIKGKFYGYEGATKKASPCIKTAGKTKGLCARPSARAWFDAGHQPGACVKYGGFWHCLAMRNNGSPYWQKI